ncbi:hypothetical protein ACM55F_17485 [Flavobacterium sp. XS2P12]|uniref:hypothetical protein n=1 Tax=Flavobacterium melibiosi TaxID=3398734 RepID=UPI003A88047E
MNSVNKSIFVFGLYSLLMGIVLLFLSNLVLPMVGLPVSKEPWLHLLGFVLICSYYYLQSALKGNIDFARYTIHTRLFAPLVVAFLIVTGKADWHFLSFGIVDGLGGIWTWIELKRNKENNIK